MVEMVEVEVRVVRGTLTQKQGESSCGAV